MDILNDIFYAALYSLAGIFLLLNIYDARDDQSRLRSSIFVFCALIVAVVSDHVEGGLPIVLKLIFFTAITLAVFPQIKFELSTSPRQIAYSIKNMVASKFLECAVFIFSIYQVTKSLINLL